MNGVKPIWDKEAKPRKKRDFIFQGSIKKKECKQKEPIKWRKTIRQKRKQKYSNRLRGDREKKYINTNGQLSTDFIIAVAPQPYYITEITLEINYM